MAPTAHDMTREYRWLVALRPVFHGIDVAAHGLSGLGKPAGFVLRQVRGWTERWQRSKTHAVPEMDALAEWLSGHLPPDAERPTICLLYTSPSPRDRQKSRMPSSA